MRGFNFFISYFLILWIKFSFGQFIYYPDSEPQKIFPDLSHFSISSRHQLPQTSSSQTFENLSPYQPPQLPESIQHEPYYPSLSQSRLSKNLADSIISFTWQLFQGSKLPDPSGNLILSPAIVQYLLSILETASEGETKNQLQQIIGNSNSAQQIKNLLQSSSTSKGKLASATGIFMDSSLNQLNRTFANTVKNLGAEINSLDFKRSELVKQIINEWAAKETRGHITNLLSSSYSIEDTVIILTSAIYFRNTWKFKFNNIGLKTFESLPGKSNQVEFMETKQFLKFKTIDLGSNYKGKVIEIPYKGEDYSMLIIVPDDNIPLDTFIRRLDVSAFDNILKTLPETSEMLMTLRMPKFHITSQFSLVNSLLKMGLVDIFTINSRLPYIGLIGDQKISDIFQKAILTVDEEGTLAAAATAAILVPLSANYDELIVDLNKPFLSVILDKNNNIPLFISKIYVPKL